MTSPRPFSPRTPLSPNEAGSSPTGHGLGGLESYARQLTILAGCFLIYGALRGLAGGSGTQALANAQDLLSIERTLGLDWERAIQQFSLRHPRLLIPFLNTFYVWAYWPILVIGFVFTWFRHRPLFYLYRNATIISGVAGLAIFAFVPVAPPRFLDGFVDTIHGAQQSQLVTNPSLLANEFAALPSFHVGWVALSCVMFASATDRQWIQNLLALPPIVMAIAVLATGNDHMIDVIAGFAIAFGGLAIASRIAHQPEVRAARAGPDG